MKTPHWRLAPAALLGSVLAAPFAAQGQAFDVYWADRWNSAYHRFSDVDGDGTFNGAGEVSFLIDPSSPASFPALSLQVTVENGQPVAYWIAEFADTIHRGVDLDGNGTIAGPGEITVFRDSGALDGQSWPQELDITDDGAVWWTAALVKANPQNGISRLEDLNGDGDAADAGEQVVMVDGVAGHSVQHDSGSGPIEAWALQAIAAAGDGVMAFAEFSDEAVYHFEDKNGDGDVTDSGESILLLNATGVRPDFPMNPDFQSGKFKKMKVQSGWYARFIHLASAMENGQRAFYFGTDSNATNPSSSTNEDGKGVNFLIYRGVDGNGDGDVNDLDEVTLFFDGSHTDGNPPLLTLRGIVAADDGPLYAIEIQPYPVLFPGPNGNTWIHQLQDLNGDGDAMDAGELQLGVFDLQVHGVTPLFPMPPDYGNMMADPYDIAISAPKLFAPAFTTTGQGCSYPTGIAPEASGTGSGLLGSSFTFELDRGEPLSAAVLTYGTSTTSWLGVPLPFELSPLGLPGCVLYQNLVGSLATTTNGLGHADVAVTLPVTPTFAGVEVPTQWVVLGATGTVQLTGLGSLLIK